MNGSVLRNRRNLVWFAALFVCLGAVVPYASTIDNYFVRDDFGIVELLASKPATYFPRWFVSSWMDEIWGNVPDEVRPFAPDAVLPAAKPWILPPVCALAMSSSLFAKLTGRHAVLIAPRPGASSISG